MNMRRLGILKNIHSSSERVHRYLVNNYGFTLVSFDTMKKHIDKDMLLAKLDDHMENDDPYFESDRYTNAGIFRVLVPTVFIRTGVTKGNIIYIRDHQHDIIKTYNEIDRLLGKWDLFNKYYT